MGLGGWGLGWRCGYALSSVSCSLFPVPYRCHIILGHPTAGTAACNGAHIHTLIGGDKAYEFNVNLN